jgi:hypothetical protein
MVLNQKKEAFDFIPLIPFIPVILPWPWNPKTLLNRDEGDTGDNTLQSKTKAYGFKPKERSL